MSKKIKELVESLCEAKLALDKFKEDEKNKQVLSALDSHQQQLNELTEAVKTASREELVDTDNDHVRVSVSRKFKSWYEPSLLDIKTIKLLKERDGLKTEVIKGVFEDLVKTGEITRELAAKSYREEEMTPSILLKWKT